MGGDLLVLCTRLATLITTQSIQGTPSSFHYQNQLGNLRKFSYIKCLHWGTSDFWWENQSYALRFKEGGDIEDLRRALADYSMDDGYPDARDAILGMADLRLAAEQHGIDPRPVFSEIAAISNPDGTWALKKYMGVRQEK